MAKLSKPKYLKLFDIQKIIKHIFCSEKRPHYLQLIPKPTKMAVILLQKLANATPPKNRTLIYSRNNAPLPSPVDDCLLGFTKVHINEKISIQDLYKNLLKSTDINKVSTSFITEENLKLIEKHDIQHMFSYSSFIKSKTSFDSNLFNSYLRPTLKTKYFLVALDCEMMICKNGKQIGRLSIIDVTGKVIYDKFIQPESEVVDYVEKYSGLNFENTSKGITLKDMRREMLEIIGIDTVVLGHGLENDLEAMQLYTENLIDTAYLFLNSDGHKIKLAQLSKIYFNAEIQSNEHDSREDAMCCLKLLSYKICEQLNFYDPAGDFIDLNITSIYEPEESKISDDRTICFMKKSKIDKSEFKKDVYYLIITEENDLNYIYFKQKLDN